MVIVIADEPDPKARAFAWRVARLRRLAGWSVDEFAAHLGVDSWQVAGWEDGSCDPGPAGRERVIGAIACVDPAGLAAAMPSTLPSTLH